MDWREIHDICEDEQYGDPAEIECDVWHPGRYINTFEPKNKFYDENKLYCHVIYFIVEVHDIEILKFVLGIICFLHENKIFFEKEADFVKCAMDMGKPEFAKHFIKLALFEIVRHSRVDLLENRDLSEYIDDLIKQAIESKQYEAQVYLTDYKYKHNLFQKKELEL